MTSLAKTWIIFGIPISLKPSNISFFMKRNWRREEQNVLHLLTFNSGTFDNFEECGNVPLTCHWWGVSWAPPPPPYEALNNKNYIGGAQHRCFWHTFLDTDLARAMRIWRWLVGFFLVISTFGRYLHVDFGREVLNVWKCVKIILFSKLLIKSKERKTEKNKL